VAKGKSHVKAKAKLESFARQYVINHLNGQQAAIAAGFAPKSARITAAKLLAKANVQERIASLLAAQIKKLDVTVERTLCELARCAYLDPRTLFRADGSLKRIIELDDDTAACIAAVEMGGRGGKRVERVKMTDKLRALDMLCKYLKMFSEDHAPQDLGVKYIICDMPRPPRPAAAAVSPQLPSPDSTQVDEHANQKAQLGLKPKFLPNLSSSK